MTHLEQISTRLRELADQLGNPELEEERAEKLAREAGELAAEAGAEVDRRLAKAASGEAPDPGEAPDRGAGGEAAAASQSAEEPAQDDG